MSGVSDVTLWLRSPADDTLTEPRAQRPPRRPRATASSKARGASSPLPQIKDRGDAGGFSGAPLYFPEALALTPLWKGEGGGPGTAVSSEAALHGQQPHRGLLQGPVDAPHLALRQRALHVAVGDAVAVAGPERPGEGERGQ